MKKDKFPFIGKQDDLLKKFIFNAKTATIYKVSKYLTVNLHITKACNYKCKFCFAKFNETHTFLRYDRWTQIIDKLLQSGCQKITFVGEEPFLHPDFEQLLRYTSQKGITTTIVTNGSLIRKKLIEKNHYYIDWIGFSIDSQYEATEIALGRTPKNTNLNHKHIGHLFSLLPTIRKYKIKIKVNTVVTSLNYQ